jgi:hydrogenase-4 component E
VAAPGLIAPLNDLAGGLFLLSAFGLVVPWQAQQCLTLFVLQSLCLAASALLLASGLGAPDLIAVGLLTLGVKSLLIPWLLRRTVSQEIYTRRELSQVVNVPSSLLIALTLAILSYFLAGPLLPPPQVAVSPHGVGTAGPVPGLAHGGDAAHRPGPGPAAAVPGGFARVNLPIGLAGLLLGAYTLLVRREAIPQVVGILAMENGAFYAGVSIAPDLPLIAELAAAFDVLVIALVMGILTRAIHEHVGTTDVASLAALRELPAAGGEASPKAAAPLTQEVR